MAFNIDYFATVTSSGNTNAVKIFAYTSSTDIISVVTDPAYFNTMINGLSVNDVIFLQASDDYMIAIVTSVTTNVTVTEYSVAALADGSVTTAKIAVGAVTTNALDGDSVNTFKLADLAVSTAKIAADAVTAAKLADDAVVTANIVDLNVTTAKIAADAVTSAKLAEIDLTAGTLITSGTGAPSASVAKGSIYLRTDGSTTNDRFYVATDAAGTWTAVTTSA